MDYNTNVKEFLEDEKFQVEIWKEKTDGKKYEWIE